MRLRALALAIAALGLTACGQRFTPPRPSALRLVRPAPAIEVTRCEPSPEPPLALAPASRPFTEGGVSLLDVRGEERFSVRGALVGAFSDDGARVYAATPEGVFVWATRTGALELALPYGVTLTHAYGMAVGAGEGYVAVSGVGPVANARGGDSDHVVLLLQTRGERRVRAFRGGRSGLVRTADGRRALMPGHSWDLVEGTWHALPALPGEPYFTPDGSRALVFLPALADRRGSIPVLYDVERGAEVHRFPTVASTHPAGFSGDGRRVAMISDALDVYDLQTFERVARIAEVNEGSAVALSYDGRLAAVSSAPRYVNADGEFRALPARASVWDLDANAPRASSDGIGGARWEFSRDRRLLVGPQGTESFALFRVENLERVRVPLPAFVSRGDGSLGPRVLNLAPDARAVLVRHDDSIEVLPLEGRPAVALARRAPVLARSPDGARTVSLDGEALRVEGGGACVRLEFAQDGDGRRRDRSFRMGHDEARFSEDGGTLFVLGRQYDARPIFRAFEAATGRERWSVLIEGRARAALGADALVVQGADRDEVLRFDASTGALALVGRPPRLESITPLLGGPTHDGRAPRGPRVSNLERALPGPGSLVATVGNFDDDVWLSVWDLREPERTVDRPAGGFVHVIASAPRTGSWALGLHGGGVRIFGPGSALAVRVDARHVGRVRALAFTRDESRLVSAGLDGSISVADTRTGTVVGRARVPYDSVHSIWISPDGTELVADTDRGFSARFRLAP